jgi:hypothetical protein
MPASLAIANELSPEQPKAATACATATRGATRHRKVLAFVRGWSLDRERPENVASMRAQLKGSDADLTVLADAGVWSFDDDATYSDRACGDTARTALLLGTRTRDDTVYVIDGSRISRYPLGTRAALASLLAEALTSRPENV